MADRTPPSAPWLFYHIQNEKGDSPQNPNASRLSLSDPERGILLQDVLNAFPLGSTGSFHFRFQVASQEGRMYLDISHPDDVVPTVGGNVIAKVLRLDAAKTLSRRVIGIVPRVVPRRSPVVTAPSPSAAAQGGPSAAPVQPARAPVTSTPSQPKPHALSPPPASSGGGAGAPAQPAPRPAPVAQPVQPVRPVVPVVVEEAVVVPDEVDADLEGKSDFVKAKVMARRNDLKKLQEERVAEAGEREAAMMSEQDEKAALKHLYDPKIREWGDETIGTQKRNVRALIANLQNVLWEGAKWEPVPMAKLIDPKRIRIYYLKAVTVVHPDKHNTIPDVGHRYVATQIFHYLEQAWREFLEKEMGGAA